MPSASLSAFARRLVSLAKRFNALLTGGSLTAYDDPEGAAEPDDPASSKSKADIRLKTTGNSAKHAALRSGAAWASSATLKHGLQLRKPAVCAF